MLTWVRTYQAYFLPKKWPWLAAPSMVRKVLRRPMMKKLFRSTSRSRSNCLRMSEDTGVMTWRAGMFCSKLLYLWSISATSSSSSSSVSHIHHTIIIRYSPNESSNIMAALLRFWAKTIDLTASGIRSPGGCTWIRYFCCSSSKSLHCL